MMVILTSEYPFFFNLYQLEFDFTLDEKYVWIKFDTESESTVQ